TLEVSSIEGRNFKGKVTRVNPSVDPVTRTFQLEATIPNLQNELHPGGFAKADVMIDRKSSGIVVPIEALVRTVGVTKVFLVVDDEKSPTKKAAREIKVTTDTEGVDWIEVVGDLPRGKDVVTSGQSQLADGSPVRIKTLEELTDDGQSAAKDAVPAKDTATKSTQASQPKQAG
ncbi:MAG: efflux RND transporter periplasmic adaptor subunit, partial [Isosphaeraceae bacterium]